MLLFRRGFKYLPVLLILLQGMIGGHLYCIPHVHGTASHEHKPAACCAKHHSSHHLPHQERSSAVFPTENGLCPPLACNCPNHPCGQSRPCAGSQPAVKQVREHDEELDEMEHAFFTADLSLFADPLAENALQESAIARNRSLSSDCPQTGNSTLRLHLLFGSLLL